MANAQQQLYEHVETLLRESFGELVKRAPDEPAFFVPLGRIGVRVEIESVGEHNALVECYSWIAQQLQVDEQLAMYLVRRNASMRFAALCVDGEGAVILRNALFPESVEKAVLARLIEVLASSADEIDEELRGRFG